MTTCGPTGLYHHEYYCTCPAVCQDCGAPAWDLCSCVKCVACGEVKVHEEGDRCPECQADYWGERRDAYYDNLSKDEGGQG